MDPAIGVVRRVAVALVAAGLLAGCSDGPAAPARSETASAASAAPSVGPSSGPSGPSAVTPPPPPAVPAGVVAGIVVFDRQAGAFTYSVNPAMRFRSASLVKLLIVLDRTWSSGTVAAADRAGLERMLRESDDDVATALWRQGGSRAVVSRMVTRLGLADTEPPPAHQPGFWGYTALSAGDVVRVYRYLLDSAPAPVRDFVLGALRASTRCGADRYDQSFGIPTAVAKPWAVKQGWSGFGDRPAQPCTATAALPLEPPALAPNPLDMSGEVLHTTGVVGAGDRTIVAVLTVHPDRTPFPAATAAVTALTRSLLLPGVNG